jgi:hypothetical protein
MNHGLAQVFGAGLPVRLTKRALVGRTVILENEWMIHGDICCALFEVGYRVATRGHHVCHESVGVRYCTSRTVNEPRLDSVPGLDKARTVAGSSSTASAFCRLPPSFTARVYSALPN